MHAPQMSFGQTDRYVLAISGDIYNDDLQAVGNTGHSCKSVLFIFEIRSLHLKSFKNRKILLYECNARVCIVIVIQLLFRIEDIMVSL